MAKKTEYAIFSEMTGRLVDRYRNLPLIQTAEAIIRNNPKMAQKYKWTIVSREITYGDWEKVTRAASREEEPESENNNIYER